jgi:hypothetical protein
MCSKSTNVAIIKSKIKRVFTKNKREKPKRLKLIKKTIPVKSSINGYFIEILQLQ